jgi:opacity protein-like surface antigen
MIRVGPLLGLTLIVLSPARAPAEPYVGIYGGAAFTQSTGLQAAIPGVTATAHDLERDTTAVVGGRAGYWLDPFPYVGLEIDVFHTRPNAPAQSVSVTVEDNPAESARLGKLDFGITTLGLNILGRWPGHRFEPYAGAGPALFFTRLKDTGSSGASIVAPSGQHDTSTTVGVQAVAGLRFFATRNIALFSEYKFSHHKPQFELNDELLGPTSVTTPFNTHYLNFGVTYHFGGRP